MRQWFPLTDYDFYGYLTAGMVVIAAVDYVFFDALLVHTNNWSFVKVGFWIGIAYVVGQILAAPSSAILEHLLMRKLLSPPLAVQMRRRERNRFEQLLALSFAPREYAPLPAATVAQIESRARTDLNLNDESRLESQALYFAGFARARAAGDTATRLDQFLNLYGFCRNMSFASLLSAGILACGAINSALPWAKEFALLALILAVGMFGRFLKFYAAYSSEVCRSLATPR